MEAFGLLIAIGIGIAFIYGLIVLIFDGIGTVSNAFMEGLRGPNVSNFGFDVDESTMESQSEPQPINDPESEPQLKSKPNPRTIPTPNRSKRKRYWFESGDDTYEYKSWHLDFLIDLDKKRGNLHKLCEEGGETLEAVMKFMKSDPVLLKTVKVIVMKYSESRYEKYFGPIKSKHRKLNPVKSQSVNPTFGVNKHIFKMMSGQAVSKTLSAPLDTILPAIRQSYSRRQSKAAIKYVAALCYQMCEGLWKPIFQEQNKIEDLYSLMESYLYYRHFNRKEVNEIKSISSGFANTNFDSGKAVSEQYLIDMVQPYSDRICSELNENDNMRKENIFNMLVNLNASQMEVSTKFIALFMGQILPENA